MTAVLKDSLVPLMSAPHVRQDAAASVYRIVHHVGCIAPWAGGPATVVARLAAAQVQQGHTVTITAALAAGERTAFEQATAGIPGFRRVHLALWPWGSGVTQWLGRRVAPILHANLHSADVLHIHGIWEPSILAAAAAARRAGIPYIVRPCGMLDPWCMRQRSMKKRLAMWWAYRRMIAGAACIHALVEDEARNIRALGFTNPVGIVPNGVSLKEIDAVPAGRTPEFQQAFPFLRDDPYVLFLGRLHHKKGLDILAQAFHSVAAEHPDLKLLVVGPDGGERSAFTRQVSALGLDQRVHVVGPVYGALKFAAYRNAACFCLPSRQEGFSLSVLEALACGTPVVVSPECHLPEVEAAGAGRIVGLDPSQVAQALCGIASATTEDRRAMGYAARAFVETRYTWAEASRQAVELYGDCVSPA